MENKTTKDVENAFNAFGGGFKVASDKRNADLIAKKGYIGFKNQEAINIFRHNNVGKYNEVVVDGETRFVPIMQSQEIIDIKNISNLQEFLKDKDLSLGFHCTSKESAEMIAQTGLGYSGALTSTVSFGCELSAIDTYNHKSGTDIIIVGIPNKLKETLYQEQKKGNGNWDEQSDIFADIQVNSRSGFVFHLKQKFILGVYDKTTNTFKPNTANPIFVQPANKEEKTTGEQQSVLLSTTTYHMKQQKNSDIFFEYVSHYKLQGLNNKEIISILDKIREKQGDPNAFPNGPNARKMQILFREGKIKNNYSQIVAMLPDTLGVKDVEECSLLLSTCVEDTALQGQTRVEHVKLSEIEEMKAKYPQDFPKQPESSIKTNPQTLVQEKDNGMEM